MGAALVLALAVLTALSWKRWGMPSFDAGLDLTVADRIARDGIAPYSDARYFYGPAGLYGLAGAFWVFGSSLTVAFAYGYALTLAVLGSFYALARRWLDPVWTGLATLVLMVIAFNGTFFDYVLAHTNAGVVGCLAIVLQVLALSRGREGLASVATGLALLTRVEFVLFAAAAVLGYALGLWREQGLRRAVRGALVTGVPGVAIAVVVYLPFLVAAGFHDLVFENLVPVDFARFGGGALQEGWAPFDVSSVVATLARAGLTVAPLAALAVGLERWRAGEGARRALTPIVALGVALVVLAGLWKATGVFGDAQDALRRELTTFLLAMSWLPIPAVGALVWALVRARRGEEAPGIGWPADLALLTAGAAMAMRGYNEFSSDSYAPYWAALPVLVTVIVLARVARARPAVRPLALAVPAVMAAALVLFAYVALWPDDTARVDTPRGSYAWYADGGPAISDTSRYIADRVPGRDPILVFADAPGLFFLSGHPSALYESTFLPGTLDTAADERAAIRRLDRRRPRMVVIGAQDTQNFGFTRWGRDYNRILGDWVRTNYRRTRTFGDVSKPTTDNQPARAFSVYEPR